MACERYYACEEIGAVVEVSRCDPGLWFQSYSNGHGNCKHAWNVQCNQYWAEEWEIFQCNHGCGWAPQFQHLMTEINKNFKSGKYLLMLKYEISRWSWNWNTREWKLFYFTEDFGEGLLKLLGWRLVVYVLVVLRVFLFVVIATFW